MKKLIPFAFAIAPSILLAQDLGDSIVQWQEIVGVITAPNINNSVGIINSGPMPWSTRDGHAVVNLATGEVSFDVNGLVLNGGGASGTAGPVTTVTGTLVCNPDTNAQTVLDTEEVRLTQQGDAHFSGRFNGLSAACANPLFLIRIGPSIRIPGVAGRWIATGALRSIGGAN